MKKGLSLLFSLGFCAQRQGIFLKPATAQVAPDGTTNTTVDVSRNDFTTNQGSQEEYFDLIWRFLTHSTISQTLSLTSSKYNQS